MRNFLVGLVFVLSFNSRAEEGRIVTECLVAESGQQCMMISGFNLKENGIRWYGSNKEADFKQCLTPYEVSVDWGNDLTKMSGYTVQLDVSKPVKNVFGKIKMRSVNQQSIPLTKGLNSSFTLVDSEVENGIICTVSTTVVEK